MLLSNSPQKDEEIHANREQLLKMFEYATELESAVLDTESYMMIILWTRLPEPDDIYILS